MNNSTTPPLTGDLLLITQLELVCPTTVVGVLYGIALTLFCLYVHALAPRLRNGERKGQTKFMLGLSTIIILCCLYNVVSNAWTTQNAYITHSNDRGGPFVYLASTYSTDPVIAISLFCQWAVETSTSAIQIWRVWVVWRATRYATLIIVLPVLFFLTFTGLALRTIVLDVTLPPAEIAKVNTITEITSTAMQVVITMFCTLSISLYLIYKQWQQKRLIRQARGSTGYRNVVVMIIESYALESIWVLASVALWNEAAGEFFGESVIFIEIIAYLLVQYRVARGKAYGTQRERRNISSLHWNHSNHATTQFGEVDGTERSPYVSALPETSNDTQLSSVA